ncbi:MAG TPA: translation initiation factor IF-3, partial [Candidatus Paceibacterota bacterium]
NCATLRSQVSLTTYCVLQRTRINKAIRAESLRVIGENGENFGVLSLTDALAKAEELGLDLIEISPTAVPPVAKIMEYGKFQYAENKKRKEAKAKTRNVETKAIQITIGTGDHDLDLKAKKAVEWLTEGHRIKVDLFLRGRAKYMDQKFLKERLERILKLISSDFKVVEEAKKSPKGLSLVIEKA